MPNTILRLLLVSLLLFCTASLVSGCGSSRSGVSYPKGQPSGPRAKPYTVRGKTYYPLKSAHGFVEEGVASWYGSDFHGKKTANGERYDMYAMTAAHKLLPFNTNLRVTNLANGKQIIVRVNDRGPFVGDRIIDLTHTGASRIGMIGPGTARVRLETVGDVPGLMQDGDLSGSFYVQIGAFSSQENARRLSARMQQRGFKARFYYAELVSFWRVQVGPWSTLSEAERMRQQLRSEFPGDFVVAE
ncbi:MULTISPECIES: septal ring lytic transglycosylase RlpA family protein [Desulfovibrionaceae]|jgi:rare lipoprotein A|uniref:Probable endolytic peptidoglycan transglycosylase RlpA n=2 Tax=Nitratidesulfovibrio vulgaris TaxID=881 RepID=Q72F18_NITV2|nr:MULTISPECIES: septal ring lytic transglycosylase RlpA family protein [Desulfovibrionaceae]GEB80068.1 hypothetical protein DDE01_14830 [Desulfovibrio desulfuricans]AAS94880.1 rare lipoprotein A, putative [Nitratidesulfovibrio vulgaris str. Hildenborough]ABM29553.1 rare lipoprotein A [Nitratidesulfovibrio vulgaris DP4]ADP85530.1 rare lipoprotein A [Nitratidesulfovibrio vulgaris RCH1]WCB47106.1 septal ring lytic transglycosylase RlpA family protein [Nitratidesulfovibrio vulgaris]